MKTTILAIETSCDETSLALLEAQGGIKNPKFRVFQNLVSSQINIHRPFGGVVPNLAKREHLKNLPLLFEQLLKSQITKKKSLTNHKLKKTERLSTLKLYELYNSPPDIIAVTVGPGLEPALWTGIEFARSIQKNYFPKAKIIGANHLEGHLYSFLLPEKTVNSKKQIPNYKNIFPAIALIVSGGHTILLKMDSLSKYKKIGETLDDAVGEAFDKVARMLELPYPGGPEIEKMAKKGNSHAIEFPRPMKYHKNYDFSFSGLKTAVLYYLRDNKNILNPKSLILSRAHVSASFQESAFDVLVYKTMKATKEYNAKSIMLSGGVAASKALREKLKTESEKLKTNFFAPPMEYNGDNATMIGVTGYLNFLKKKKLPLKAKGSLSL